jgi:hypothetical protein
VGWKYKTAIVVFLSILVIAGIASVAAKNFFMGEYPSGSLVVPKSTGTRTFNELAGKYVGITLILFGVLLMGAVWLLI